MTTLEWALKYQANGYSVIPVGKDKTPLIEWTKYQKELPDKEQVKKWWDKQSPPNIAIVTGKLSNLTVIDTDSDEATKKIQDMIPESLEVPVQSSPRGGRHFFFQYQPDLTSKRIEKDIDIKTEGGLITMAPSMNGHKKHWFWPDGASLFEIGVPAIPINIYNYIYSLYKGFVASKPQAATKATSGHKLFVQGQYDEALFHTANSLVKGGMDKENISEVLKILMDSWGESNLEGWREQKIISAFKRAEQKDRNIASEVREWVAATNGHFSATESHKELQTATRNERRAVNIELQRMAKDNIIQRVGDKNGFYRRVESEIEEMDWETAEDTILDVTWPFGIEKLYQCLPKNIIVVAGSPDSGKTAFCLNFAMMNMDKYKINYFSSEMGRLELKDRLKKFREIDIKKWKKVRFVERSYNFADVINPDEINIIDYIEVPEEAWKIGTPLRQIYEKLDKGIAVIALQKPRNRDVARGGDITLEKPRLYLSMGNGEIKIIKAKNWATERNPNNLSLEYKIAQGCRFTQQSEWSIPYNETRVK